ncbi:hypothetical protein GCM10022600_15120 [Qipengyuania pelagi]|uniref:Chromosomal replication initiator DnaA C-terminal domain-containing protein n=1 Tax=Qipengyuania pelagi TaxID=994320 RepID=A0A844Y8M9_9SPHN|nr:helix-turn-helix domain-containing protein [Qipengyuania pelagi]MXO53633.1 hypothetical protein [Qipengyuania pelagi]
MNGDPDMRAHRDAVAKAFGVEPWLMASRSRKQPEAFVRQTGYWVLRTAFPAASFAALGRLFGGRDRTTIVHGVTLAERRRAIDADYRALTDQLAVRAGIDPVSQVLVDRLTPEPSPREPDEAELAAKQAMREARQIAREENAFPHPRVHTLGLQLKGEAGCPRLDEAEVMRRRSEVLANRRAREIALLEQEQAKYRLPRRGLALSEMAL